jgi:hypothetical protein
MMVSARDRMTEITGPIMRCAGILRGRGDDPISRPAGARVLSPGRAEEKAKLVQEISREDGRARVPGHEQPHGIEAVRIAE